MSDIAPYICSCIKRGIVEKKLKIIILALVAFLVISVFIIFALQSSKSALMREYISTRQRLTQQNEELNNRLNTVVTENRGLQGRLEAIQRDLEGVSSERDKLARNYELVNKEREELLERLKVYAQLQKDLETSKDENKTLKSQVNSLERYKLNLETELNKLRRENEDLKQKFVEAESKTTSVSEVGSIDLPPIVISPQVSSDIGLSSSLKGKILSVNSEYNFVVVDLGRSNGLKEGMVFEVLREGRLLGKVEVIQAREKIAACDIIQADSPFKAGDFIRY